MGTFSIWHWLVVLAIVVLVFGTKKLRNLGGDLGGALKSFKEGIKESEAENISSPPPQMNNQTIEGEVNQKTEAENMSAPLSQMNSQTINTGVHEKVETENITSPPRQADNQTIEGEAKEKKAVRV